MAVNKFLRIRTLATLGVTGLLALGVIGCGGSSSSSSEQPSTNATNNTTNASQEVQTATITGTLPNDFQLASDADLKALTVADVGVVCEDGNYIDGYYTNNGKNFVVPSVPVGKACTIVFLDRKVTSGQDSDKNAKVVAVTPVVKVKSKNVVLNISDVDETTGVAVIAQANGADVDKTSATKVAKLVGKPLDEAKQEVPTVLATTTSETTNPTTGAPGEVYGNVDKGWLTKRVVGLANPVINKDYDDSTKEDVDINTANENKIGQIGNLLIIADITNNKIYVIDRTTNKRYYVDLTDENYLNDKTVSDVVIAKDCIFVKASNNKVYAFVPKGVKDEDNHIYEFEMYVNDAITVPTGASLQKFGNNTVYLTDGSGNLKTSNNKAYGFHYDPENKKLVTIVIDKVTQGKVVAEDKAWVYYKDTTTTNNKELITLKNINVEDGTVSNAFTPVDIITLGQDEKLKGTLDEVDPVESVVKVYLDNTNYINSNEAIFAITTENRVDNSDKDKGLKARVLNLVRIDAQGNVKFSPVKWVMDSKIWIKDAGSAGAKDLLAVAKGANEGTKELSDDIVDTDTSIEGLYIKDNGSKDLLMIKFTKDGDEKETSINLGKDVIDGNNSPAPIKEIYIKDGTSNDSLVIKEENGNEATIDLGADIVSSNSPIPTFSTDLDAITHVYVDKANNVVWITNDDAAGQWIKKAIIRVPIKEDGSFDIDNVLVKKKTDDDKNWSANCIGSTSNIYPINKDAVYLQNGANVEIAYVAIDPSDQKRKLYAKDVNFKDKNVCKDENGNSVIDDGNDKLASVSIVSPYVWVIDNNGNKAIIRASFDPSSGWTCVYNKDDVDNNYQISVAETDKALVKDKNNLYLFYVNGNKIKKASKSLDGYKVLKDTAFSISGVYGIGLGDDSNYVFANLSENITDWESNVQNIANIINLPNYSLDNNYITKVGNDFVYVTNNGGVKTSKVATISDIDTTDAKVVAHLFKDAANKPSISNVYAYGNKLYFVDKNGNLYVVDGSNGFANVADPKPIINLPNGIDDVAASSDGKVIAVASKNYLKVLDDNGNVVQTIEVKVALPNGVDPETPADSLKVAVAGDYVYVLADFANKPVVLEGASTTVNKSFIYLLTYKINNGKLKLVNAQKIDELSGAATTLHFAKVVGEKSNANLYIAYQLGTNDKVKKLALTNPEKPTVIGEAELPSANKYVFSSKGIYVLDIDSDPDALQILDLNNLALSPKVNVDIPLSTNAIGYGDYLFVADDDKNVNILDLSKLATERKIRKAGDVFLDAVGPLYVKEINNKTYLFVGTSNKGLYIVDLNSKQIQ